MTVETFNGFAKGLDPRILWGEVLAKPLDVSASSLHILHSNGSLEVWPEAGHEASDHVYQCRVSLAEVGSLLSVPATLRSPGETRRIRRRGKLLWY